MSQVLEGTLVVELGTMITAPLAGMMLGDLGARVIKVEHPKGGDPFRGYRGDSYSPHFAGYNRNKESIQLDLQSEEGLRDLRELIRRADVLLDNFRPGVLDRLKLTNEALRKLNPGLVHCSITGFGPRGPYRDRPAYDAVGVALSGLSSLLIDPENPYSSGPTIADNVTGMYACYGILGALLKKARTGKGSRVETNMLEASVAFIPDSFASYTLHNIVSHPRTRVASSQSYALMCADRSLIAVHLSIPDKFWEGLLTAIERPELAVDERFNSREKRVRNFEALTMELAGIFKTRTREEWYRRLEAQDVPCAPVYSIPEVFDDPQIQHLGTFYHMHHAKLGDLTGVHRPVLIDGERGPATLPAPTLGEHTETIRAEYLAQNTKQPEMP
jgi:crotonobetainyl-CoA:carnitine CoA-transferase CaiB-like acyl-CoA transferase